MAASEGTPYSRVAPDAEFIGAGDEVVILDEDFNGHVFILADVEGDEACLRYQDGSGAVLYRPFSMLAHPDSPQAEAWAVYGDERLH